MGNNIREIKEKSIAFSKIIDMDLDFQESLMSYNDDMLKIIRCNVNNYVVNTDCKNGSLTVYGKSKISVTYLSENDKCISTADFEEDFQKNIQLDENLSETSANISIVNKYNNYRVINQRRIDIHNSFAIDIKVFSAKPFNMIESSENLLMKKDKISYCAFIGNTFSKADFEEALEIPSDSESIKKIINSFSNVRIEEVKIIADKMLVKTQILLSFLYTTDTDNEIIKKCERTFSVNKIIEIDGIDENDFPLVNICIGNLYIKTKTNKSNELRVIEMLGDINISASVYRITDDEFSTDCYATNNEVINTFDKVVLNTNCELLSDIIDGTLLFEFDNIKIIEILDLSLNIIDKKTVELNAFVINENSEVLCLNKKQNIESDNAQVYSMFIKSFDYVIKSEQSISIRYSIEYSAICFDEKAFNILSNVEITDEVLSETPALVVYFAKERERVWDIAKKFRTSSNLIMAENELNNEILSTSRVLLIPGI